MFQQLFRRGSLLNVPESAQRNAVERDRKPGEACEPSKATSNEVLSQIAELTWNSWDKIRVACTSERLTSVEGFLFRHTDVEQDLSGVLPSLLAPGLLASHHFNDDTTQAPHVDLAASNTVSPPLKRL